MTALGGPPSPKRPATTSYRRPHIWSSAPPPRRHYASRSAVDVRTPRRPDRCSAYLTMAVLAVILSLCSEADAFVAASLTMLPLLPRLVFLVVGPAVDLKLFAMQAGLFGRAFAVRFAPVTFVVATLGRYRCRAADSGGAMTPGDGERGFAARRHQHRHHHDHRRIHQIRQAFDAAVAGRVGNSAHRACAGLDRPGYQTGIGHGPHGRRAPSSVIGVVWLLVVPIALLGFLVPPAITPEAAAPAIVEVSKEVLRRPFPPLPDERAPTLSLPEVLVRIARDSANTLDGKLVTVTGFTFKADGRTDLARVVIICCAADASLARIRLSGPAAPQIADYPEDTWLRVEAKVPAGQDWSRGSTIPVMDVLSESRIDPPTNPYAY